MRRALLLQALEAMQEIYFYILSSNNNLPYKKLQEGIEAITAALAQPEPSPVLTMPSSYTEKLKTLFGQDRREAWVVAIENENFSDFPDTKYAASFAHDYFIEGWEAAVTKYAAPPDTYRNPADDAALKRSFEAMDNGIVAELVDALRGVIRVADRATDEFDAARAAIEKATKEQQRPRIFIDSPYLDKDSNWANYSDPITPLWAIEKGKSYE